MTVDLEREREWHSLFAQRDPKRVLAELGVLKGRSVTPGKTLLFLDEIQACPPALAMLRYFHELMPELHVIAAGSLLDFALREFEYSMPVGRIEFLHLHPMSFEEFLEATLKGGEDGKILEPGKSADSQLVHSVARLDEDEAMPPADKGKPLTKEEVGLIRAWIDQGAK